MSEIFTQSEPHHWRMSIQECCYCPSRLIRKLIFSESHVIHTCQEHILLAERDIKVAYFRSGVILSTDVLKDDLFELIPKEFQGVTFCAEATRFLIRDKTGWNIPIKKIDESASTVGTLAISVSELVNLIPDTHKDTPLLAKFLEKLEKGFYEEEFIEYLKAKEEKAEIKRPDVSNMIKEVILPDGRIVRTINVPENFLS